MKAQARITLVQFTNDQNLDNVLPRVASRGPEHVGPGGHLDTVVHRVADHVHQGVADVLHDGLVELRISSISRGGLRTRCYRTLGGSMIGERSSSNFALMATISRDTPSLSIGQ